MAQVHHLRSNPSHPLKRKWRSFGNDEICLSLVLLRSRRPNNHSSNIHNSNNNTLHPRTPSTNTQVSSTHNNIITKPHLNSTLIYSPNNIHIRMCRARINSNLNQTGIIPISTAMVVYTIRIQCLYQRVMADHRTMSVPLSLHLTIIPICQGGQQWIPSTLGSLGSLWIQQRSPLIPKRYRKRVSRKEGNVMDVPSLSRRNGEGDQMGLGVCATPVE
jgi:hypothetical protein